MKRSSPVPAQASLRAQYSTAALRENLGATQRAEPATHLADGEAQLRE